MWMRLQGECERALQLLDIDRAREHEATFDLLSEAARS